MFLTKKGRAKMLVYHGSNNLFTEFDYSRMGETGTAEGQGFYFTDSLDVANMYSEKGGYIYECEFSGKKSLNSEKITLKRSEIKKVLLALHSEADILWDWEDIGAYGLNKVLNIAIDNLMTCKSDVDIYGGLCNSSGDTKLVAETFYKVLGYDSIVAKVAYGNNHTVYVATITEIIKIINVKQK